MTNKSIFFCALCLTALPAMADSTTVNTNFTDGDNGWRGASGFDGQGGGTTIVPRGGNDAHFMRTVFNNFWIEFYNDSNLDYLSDYTTSDLITLSIDVRVENLHTGNVDVSRPWTVELRDYDRAGNGLPYSSVWFTFDQISEAHNSDWTTYSVTFDPNSEELPAGWGGYGAEDPDTYEPILPEGVTFSDILSGIDEISFMTIHPGLFSAFTDHTIGIDNVSITRTTVPAPSALALIGLSGLVGTRRKR